LPLRHLHNRQPLLPTTPKTSTQQKHLMIQPKLTPKVKLLIEQVQFECLKTNTPFVIGIICEDSTLAVGSNMDLTHQKEFISEMLKTCVNTSNQQQN
jgi:hypothetical protein